jgi:hypothetical protein
VLLHAISLINTIRLINDFLIPSIRFSCMSCMDSTSAADHRLGGAYCGDLQYTSRPVVLSNLVQRLWQSSWPIQVQGILGRCMGSTYISDILCLRTATRLPPSPFAHIRLLAIPVSGNRACQFSPLCSVWCLDLISPNTNLANPCIALKGAVSIPTEPYSYFVAFKILALCPAHRPNAAPTR